MATAGLEVPAPPPLTTAQEVPMQPAEVCWVGDSGDPAHICESALRLTKPPDQHIVTINPRATGTSNTSTTPHLRQWVGTPPKSNKGRTSTA